MAFKLLGYTVGTSHASTRVTAHFFGERDGARLEGILGNCHLCHVSSKEGAA